MFTSLAVWLGRPGYDPTLEKQISQLLESPPMGGRGFARFAPFCYHMPVYVVCIWKTQKLQPPTWEFKSGGVTSTVNLSLNLLC